jgi:hypothetical protein
MMVGRICLAGIFFLVVGCLGTAPAGAHQTAISTLNVELRAESREVDMLLAISAEDLAVHLELGPDGDGMIDQSQLEHVKPTIAAYLDKGLSVRNGGDACEPAERDFVDTGRRSATLLYRYTAACEQALGKVVVENSVLHESPAGYTHLGQLQLGEDIHTTVFNRDTPTYTIEVAPEGDSLQEQSLADVFKLYVWQGVLHIVLGIDHVLFVILLLLAARTLRRLLLVVTSFTLAHSITLVLSALDVVTLAPAIVEPLIAVSIGWVALELLLGDDDGPGKQLFLLTFLFGLLHGFGFSYVLRDELGLPADALVSALVSFNVGVEIGQLAIVAAAFPLVKWARTKEWSGRATSIVAGAVLVLAAVWFVMRLVG